MIVVYKWGFKDKMDRVLHNLLADDRQGGGQQILEDLFLLSLRSPFIYYSVFVILSL